MDKSHPTLTIRALPVSSDSLGDSNPSSDRGALDRLSRRLNSPPADHYMIPHQPNIRAVLSVYVIVSSIGGLIKVLGNEYTQAFRTNMKRLSHLSMLAFSWALVTFAPNPKRTSAYRKRLSEYNRWYFSTFTKKY